MHLHTDFARETVLDVESLPWVPSPQPGVERRMLERDGGELARATSIVRYAPGSRFPTHVHDRGEEFLVLRGRFDDEHGRYGPGTYVRNPPGSRHAPSSAEGCTIFVKLRQFVQDDTRSVVVAAGDASGPPWITMPGGHRCRSMHTHGDERVAMIDLPPGFAGNVAATDVVGWEILLLAGSLSVEGGRLDAPTWWRRPTVSPLRTRDGATLWMKTGHLR